MKGNESVKESHKNVYRVRRIGRKRDEREKEDRDGNKTKKDIWEEECLESTLVVSLMIPCLMLNTRSYFLF